MTQIVIYTKKDWLYINPFFGIKKNIYQIKPKNPTFIFLTYLVYFLLFLPLSHCLLLRV